MRATPILRIFDESKARRFYLDFLGYRIDFEHRFEPDLPLYMQVSRDESMLHLSKHHGDGTPGQHIRIEVIGDAEFHAELVNPQFVDPPHIRLMASLLETAERGELRRLMINLPPRLGKSSLCSQLFPAWYLGRHPDRNVIIATHSAELSERNSRAARSA